MKTGNDNEALAVLPACSAYLALEPLFKIFTHNSFTILYKNQFGK